MGADYYATTIIGCKVTLQDLVIKKKQSYISCKCHQNQSYFKYCSTCGNINQLHDEITGLKTGLQHLYTSIMD